MRLLVVDDDQVFREEVGTFLTDDGHDVEVANSVRKALEHMEQGSFDVVLTDLKMPRQGGLDLLREVRERWPATLVVVVTGFATVPTAVEAMKLGAFDYIAKPFRTDQVRQVLSLAGEQLRFAGTPPMSSAPFELARLLGRRQNRHVLYAARELPANDPRVDFFAFDGKSPSELIHALDQFLAKEPAGGMVVAEVDRMLVDHSLDDVLDILRALRDRIGGRGPFAVGLPAERMPRAQVESIRSVVTDPTVQHALEAVSSPIRRRVMYRLTDGPISFSEAMKAAELEDSPKMAFHLHRLVEEGLASHEKEQYRLTPKGAGVVDLLREMESVAGGAGLSAFVFETAGESRAGSTLSAKRG